MRAVTRRLSHSPCKHHHLPMVDLDPLRASVRARVPPPMAWIVQHVLHRHRYQNSGSQHLGLFDDLQVNYHIARLP